MSKIALVLFAKYMCQIGIYTSESEGGTCASEGATWYFCLRKRPLSHRKRHLFLQKEALVPQKEVFVPQKEAIVSQKEEPVPQKEALVPAKLSDTLYHTRLYWFTSHQTNTLY